MRATPCLSRRAPCRARGAHGPDHPGSRRSPGRRHGALARLTPSRQAPAATARSKNRSGSAGEHARHSGCPQGRAASSIDRARSPATAVDRSDSCAAVRAPSEAPPLGKRQVDTVILAFPSQPVATAGRRPPGQRRHELDILRPLRGRHLGRHRRDPRQRGHKSRASHAATALWYRPWSSGSDTSDRVNASAAATSIEPTPRSRASTASAPCSWDRVQNARAAPSSPTRAPARAAAA